MIKQFEIRRPIICVLKSPPSTLGSIGYNMVLFDDEHEVAFRDQMDELAEDIDDQENYYPFFLLHSTSSWGDSIDPLNPRSNETQFRINQTNVDSVLLFHCLACRNQELNVLLKSGFHSWAVSESPDKSRPSCWDSMNSMNGNIHLSVTIDSLMFWRTYCDAIDEWKAEVDS